MRNPEDTKYVWDKENFKIIQKNIMKEEVKNEPNNYGVYEINADSSLNKSCFTLKQPEPKWSIEFAPNCFIYTPDNRNWFNRLMQRLILGFKWKRI